MIRLAYPSDVEAARRVEVSAAAAFAGTHMDFAVNHPPNSADELLAAIARGLMWVAVAEGVVGFVFAEPCAQGLYIRELAVAAAAQRQGHGAALMAAVIAAAGARGEAMLVLTTDRTLPWNAPFYRRLGFAIVEGEAVPIAARRRLEAQFAAGFDPAHRCAMVLAL